MRSLLPLILCSCLIENKIQNDDEQNIVLDAIHEDIHEDVYEDNSGNNNYGEQLDVLMVIDKSCSMDNDWENVSYGAKFISTQLVHFNLDWKLSITSSDPYDQFFFEVPYNQNPESDVDIGLELLRNNGGDHEMLFRGAQRVLEEYPDFFRENVTDLVVFITDAKNYYYSNHPNVTSSEFEQSWDGDFIFASISGPTEVGLQSSCGATYAPEFYSISDIYVDICTTEPWNVVEKTLNILQP